MLRSISRYATQNLEESGYNSLFIQLGSLKWYDQKSNNSPNYAPLLLIPVEINRTRKGYTIEILDESPYFNVTLQEKLKQEFDVHLAIPDTLETDEGWVRIASILRTVRQAVKKKASWEVVESAGLGIFSFTQYVIWKDLESNIDRYRKNPIVCSMIEGIPYKEDSIVFDAEPNNCCLIVPADGSQVRAVNVSENR